MKFEFKDGTILEGDVVTQALCVYIVRTADNHYQLVSKFALKDDGESEED